MKLQDGPLSGRMPSATTQSKIDRTTDKSALRPIGMMVMSTTSKPDRFGGTTLLRWHELALYRSGETWTAVVAFRSQVETEDGNCWAKRGSADQIAAWLLPACGSCPMPEWHVGFPKGSRNHARSQAGLLDDIRVRYREAAAGLLSTHLEFAETIACGY